MITKRSAGHDQDDRYRTPGCAHSSRWEFLRDCIFRRGGVLRQHQEEDIQAGEKPGGCGRRHRAVCVPIVNKRISVTLIADRCSSGLDDYTVFAKRWMRRRWTSGLTLSAASGWCTRARPEATCADRIAAIGTGVHAARVCSFVNVASTRTGINMDAVSRWAAY